MKLSNNNQSPNPTEIEVQIENKLGLEPRFCPPLHTTTSQCNLNLNQYFLLPN